MGLRIVVAADPAAVEYKDVVKADLEADSRVDDVIDVGVQAGDDTLYPVSYTHLTLPTIYSV